MTTPKPTSSNTSTPAASGRTRTEDDEPRADTGRSDAAFEELSRSHDEAEDRARELLAAQVLQESRNGSHDERARQLVLAVRRDQVGIGVLPIG